MLEARVIIRLLADEDLDDVIAAGLRSIEPAIDILDVKTSGLRGTKDSALLELAVREDRILITHDRNTMTRYFHRRMSAGEPCPGIFIVPQRASAGEIIDSLVLVWAASQAEEWRDRIVYLPMR